MKNFKIAQPQSIEQVTALLAQGAENYFIMAGGTDILDEIKNEIIAPEVLIDLTSISNLSYINVEKDGMHIGALTTVAAIAEHSSITSDYPVLHEAALSLATPQLRNIGTLGGNLCQRPRCWYYRDPDIVCRKKGGNRCFAFRGKNKYHAIFGGGMCYIVYPSDLAPALITLDAEVVIATAKGDKKTLLENFYMLPNINVKKENGLGAGEVVKEVRIPLPKSGDRSTYLKMKERNTWDFAVVSAAVKGTVSGNLFTDLKIVLGGVAPIPWKLKKAEPLITSKAITENLLKEAIKEELAAASPLAENDYKKDLVEAAVLQGISSLR